MNFSDYLAQFDSYFHLSRKSRFFRINQNLKTEFNCDAGEILIMDQFLKLSKIHQKLRTKTEY